ncbi:23S rRNA (guanosine(2251)-2'-O)-methyltransferase RlmB [[Mycoplasma] testudinis]|uniref:23S rRNA (guanosine(2251)-2'-O)-methyltransferase RlmB n=1 Tax=[Mycoplasma] testudinis TaxID=33924 RepID=UPI000A010014|nr:23S rRNA (guanosine(2251)-2'-O)-methyltransferase RlmB [[Mycoplasma] testudinis]
MNRSFSKKPHRSPTYLIGRKSVLDGFANKLPIKKIMLFKPDNLIVGLAKDHDIEIEMHSLKWFDTQINKNFNHQGTVALVDVDNIFISPEALLAKTKTKQKSLIVVLDKIMDPGNFGAILRTCLAAGVDGVIFKTENQAPINNTVIKTSLGAVFSLNLVNVANLRYVMEKFKSSGFWTVISSLDESSINYTKLDAEKVLLVLGNEDAGVSPLLAKEADFKVKIPMSDQMQSLNVSVAAGILIYEIKKQQGF